MTGSVAEEENEVQKIPRRPPMRLWLNAKLGIHGVRKKRIWSPQPVKEMEPRPRRKSAAIRGTMVEMSMRSMSDSQLRKKYMGLCRRESILMTRIMSPLPERATRNMTMMMEKRRRCRGVCMKRPRRTK